MTGCAGASAQIAADSRGKKVADVHTTDGVVKAGHRANGLYHVIVRTAGSVNTGHLTIIN